MAQQLPQDLIIETIVCLPVKSLLRFRCLSKPLCALIDSPDFINSHHNKSSQSFNLRKMIFWDSEYHVCDVNADLEEENILRLDNQFTSIWKDGGVYGYCKGLLLMSGSKYKFSLWNPSTRNSRDLSLPFSVDDDDDDDDDYNNKIIATGLGYDDSIDDYKAVFIVKLELEEQIWIYRLKSNIWTRGQNFPNFPHIFKLRNVYFTDGSLHWLMDDGEWGWKEEIVAFDLRKETFSLADQPVGSTKYFVYGVTPKLHVLEECLCISYMLPTPRQVDLYIRKKDGVDDQFTWTKLFVLKESEPILDKLDLCWHEFNVLGYSNRGDKILFDIGVFDNGEDHMIIISYDLKEKSFGKVEIDSLLKNSQCYCRTLCVETLESVDS